MQQYEFLPEEERPVGLIISTTYQHHNAIFLLYKYSDSKNISAVSVAYQLNTSIERLKTILFENRAQQ
jgi:hypothetical protein